MSKTFTYIAFCLLLLSAGCSDSKPSASLAESVDSASIETNSAYFTEDPEGNPVLCWTAKHAADSLSRVKYAVYNNKENRFGNNITVDVSAGTSASAESMNKIAFKEDGTVIVLFAKKFKNEKNPYAGAIFYSISEDKGGRWSAPKFLSSDTSHAYGRSFFDVAKLKNGEIAAIWLDGRFGRSEKGSALFFARTEKGRGFAKDSCISKSTCECCRTDLLVDGKGELHIAYRSILYPPALIGKQVRDMVYFHSRNNGKSFSRQQTISKDNWLIDGCPHTGPSLAASGSRLHACWFTGEGKKGIYYSSKDAKPEFEKRQLITASGRHPQLISLGKDKLALVCEEDESPASQHEHHSGMKQEQSSGSSRIMLRIMTDAGKEIQKIALSDGKNAAHHPVISSTKAGLLVAWTENTENTSRVVYCAVKL